MDENFIIIYMVYFIFYQLRCVSYTGKRTISSSYQHLCQAIWNYFSNYQIFINVSVSHILCMPILISDDARLLFTFICWW